MILTLSLDLLNDKEIDDFVIDEQLGGQIVRTHEIRTSVEVRGTAYFKYSIYFMEWNQDFNFLDLVRFFFFCVFLCEGRYALS